MYYLGCGLHTKGYNLAPHFRLFRVCYGTYVASILHENGIAESLLLLLSSFSNLKRKNVKIRCAKQLNFMCLIVSLKEHRNFRDAIGI